MAAIPGLAQSPPNTAYMGLAGGRKLWCCLLGRRHDQDWQRQLEERPQQHDLARHPLQLRCRHRLPPAPAPIPQRRRARSYLVFFDWDRADLTDRPADHSRRQGPTGVQVTRIEVSGHTDTTGTASTTKACRFAGRRTAGPSWFGVWACRRARSPGRGSPGGAAGGDGPERARAAEPPGRDHHPLISRRLTWFDGLGRREAPFSSAVPLSLKRMSDADFDDTHAIIPLIYEFWMLAWEGLDVCAFVVCVW